MDKLQFASDLLLSLDNRLDQLAVTSKADPAYRPEREEIQIEMRALYEELSGEKLDGEVQENAAMLNSADVLDKGLLGVLTGTVDLMKNLLLTIKVSMKRESDTDRVLLALDNKGHELLTGYGSLLNKA